MGHIEDLRLQREELRRLLEVEPSQSVEEREALERRLHANDARTQLLLRATFDQALDAMFFLDQEGRWIDANPAACRIFGRPSEDLVGRRMEDFVAPGTKHVVARGTSHGIGVRGELSILRADGQRRELEYTASETLGADVSVVIMRDITDRKRLEEQLRAAQKMEAIGGLAAGIAHDFNNLLSTILSYAELILDDLKPGDPLAEDVAEIRHAGRRAAEMTRKLLAFSRQQVLEPRVVDINQTIEGIARMLRRMVGEDIELTTLLAPHLGHVDVDPVQLEQVLLNLAVNARDAMPNGGKLTIETHDVELDEDYARAHHGVVPGSYVMVAVTDTGHGIDKETLTRIYEPFFTTKPEGIGTGLGLATVYGIVRQSGGHIWAYSEVDVGTTFKVYLPRSGKVLSPKPRSSLAPTTFRGVETILLVEDEDHVRHVARRILRQNGYTVLEAQNGGEAFLICETHRAPIHLLLTDVVMPRMSGREVAERLAHMRPEMKVLFMSGYTGRVLGQHGILDSTYSYLQKPLTPDSLLRAVRGVLDARDSSARGA